MTLLAVFDSHGDWQVRVVPNKFPVVTCEASLAHPVAEAPPIQPAQPALGGHEIVIESPRHVRDITQLTLDEFTSVLKVFRARLEHWAQDGRIEHVTLTKNVGYAAGASLEHAHSHLIALPFVPSAVVEELQGARRYFSDHQACIFCRLLEKEIDKGVRLVAEEGPFVAFCAYAGRQPYETWILPTTHSAHYTQLSDDDAVPLAKILQKTLSQLQSRLTPLSYNLIFHTAPFDRGANPIDASCFHWHCELVPRTTQLAGFEWGAAVNINPVAPERAAAFLRGAR